MDAAAAALADLVEISSQIEAAVLLGTDGSVVASTLGDELRAKRFAETAKRLFDAAVDNEAEIGSPPLQQLEAATLEGSVFVVRDDDRLVAAVTGPEPTVGLVFYDLKAALRQSAQTVEAPKPRRTRKKASEPDIESSEAQAPETQPSETQPSETEPSETEPSEPQLSETEPSEAQASESRHAAP
jgi:predicted regulator of Ras-like GTPase activity (Roadblock/LC7/MglB family)